jgi:hypothetical protein
MQSATTTGNLHIAATAKMTENEDTEVPMKKVENKR